MKKKHFVLIGLGFELLGFVILGLYVGRILSDTYGNQALLPLVLFFCLGLWFFHFFIMIKKFVKDEDNKP